MSPLGRWTAIGAATLGLVTVATWNAGSPSSASDTRLDGSQLFRAKGCATCHAGPDTVSEFDAVFPSLAAAPEWAGTRRPGLNARAYLTESMVAPGAFVSPDFHNGRVGPTTAMPQLPLTDEEINALVDYLLRP